MPDDTTAQQSATASAKIDDLIDDLDDWRGEFLADIRRLIRQELPDVVETWKWMGSPVWEHDGIIAVGNAHKAKVKLTFPHGAALDDSHQLFNAGLGGKAWRAIDLLEGDSLNAAALCDLIREAADHNARVRRP